MRYNKIYLDIEHDNRHIIEDKISKLFCCNCTIGIHDEDTIIHSDLNIELFIRLYNNDYNLLILVGHNLCINTPSYFMPKLSFSENTSEYNSILQKLNNKKNELCEILKKLVIKKSYKDI